MKADTIAHDKWHCRITRCAQNKARQIGRAYFPRDNSQKYAPLLLRSHLGSSPMGVLLPTIIILADDQLG